MGTRGTLHVYLNGELKIRQYNQWDSYPTGQFQNICEFFTHKPNVERLTERLLNTKFLPREEMEKFKEDKSLEDKMAEAYMKVLIDRDFGADILWAVAGMPRACQYMPDWVDVFRMENDESTELPPEEGNYVIHITCEKEYYCTHTAHIKKDTEVHFKLSGEFWGVEKEFGEDVIPTEEEVEAWEKEARQTSEIL